MVSGLSSNVFASTPGKVKIGSCLRETTLHGLNSKRKTITDLSYQ
jgi:hypothetical protein